MTQFESVAAELLALPPDDFTARRNARINEIKAAGDAELAAQLTALRKPSLPLWSVNQLAAGPRVLSAVRDAAQAVGQAQIAGAAAELREASRQFERQLQHAGEAAAEALRVHGHAAGEAVERRAREIVRVAALRGGETWHRLELGALTTEPEFIDSLEMFAVAAAPAATTSPPRAATRSQLRRAERKANDDAEQAQQALEVARSLREDAATMAAAAEQAAARAHEAEAAARHAREQADQSRRELEQLQSAVDPEATR
jgi:hypothetical protein